MAVSTTTLGSALPDAIGAKLAQPGKPVVALAGDGGFMFTVQELVTGAELGLPLPILLWNNQGLKQIQDDMKARDIEPVGVSGINPDFIALAKGLTGGTMPLAESLVRPVETVLSGPASGKPSSGSRKNRSSVQMRSRPRSPR